MANQGFRCQPLGLVLASLALLVLYASVELVDGQRFNQDHRFGTKEFFADSYMPPPPVFNRQRQYRRGDRQGDTIRQQRDEIRKQLRYLQSREMSEKEKLRYDSIRTDLVKEALASLSRSKVTMADRKRANLPPVSACMRVILFGTWKRMSKNIPWGCCYLDVANLMTPCYEGQSSTTTTKKPSTTKKSTGGGSTTTRKPSSSTTSKRTSSSRRPTPTSSTSKHPTNEWKTKETEKPAE